MLNKKNVSLGAIAVIVLFGGLGGLTSGIANPKCHQIILPISGSKVEIGVFGEILVGSMASLVAYLFLGLMFGFLIEKEEKVTDWIKLISISILAGFMGINYLNSVSSKVQNITETTNNKNSAYLYIQQGIHELDKGKEVLKNMTGNESKRIREAKLRYTKALLDFQLATKDDNSNMTALIEKAKAHRALALLPEERKDENEKNFHIREALGTLNKVIEKDPDNARAYYNRACYLVLFKLNEKGIHHKIESDLNAALKHPSAFRKLSKEDDDFKAIRSDKNNPRYTTLIKLVNNH